MLKSCYPVGLLTIETSLLGDKYFKDFNAKEYI